MRILVGGDFVILKFSRALQKLKLLLHVHSDMVRAKFFTSVQKCQMFILSSRDLKVIDDNFLEVLMIHSVKKLFLEALKTFQSLQ